MIIAMKKLTFMIMFCLILSGCSDIQVKTTHDRTPATTEGTRGIESATPTKNYIVPSPTIPAITSTSTIEIPTIISLSQFTPLCDNLLTKIVAETDWAYGLVTYNTSSSRLVVWGERGPSDPYYSQLNPDSEQRGGWFDVSTDHNWISYVIYNPGISFDYVVLNPKTGDKIDRAFGDILVSRFANPRWLNALQVIIPLENQGETYKWIAWLPFTQEQIEKTIELTGIGNANEHHHVGPVVDPLFELVTFACDDCGENEFTVKSLQTGEVLWTIDIGETPDTIYRRNPVWSPDGRYLAIIFGLNKVWIYNRQGQIISKIDLPFDGVIDYWIGSRFEWSPDGNYLAFTRAISESSETGFHILSYYSLRDQRLYDVDRIGTTGEMVWSYDSTRLFLVNRSATDDVNIETIFDLSTCQSIQLIDLDEHRLIGWLNLKLEP